MTFNCTLRTYLHVTVGVRVTMGKVACVVLVRELARPRETVVPPLRLASRVPFIQTAT